MLWITGCLTDPFLLVFGAVPTGGEQSKSP